MSMHITACTQEQFGHVGEFHDLGYWEGDPPAVGDHIDLNGVVCEVLRRLWEDNLSVRLLVERRPGEVWMVNQ